MKNINDILGFIGKDIKDFHIDSKINLNEDFYLITVFVDNYYYCFIVSTETNKVNSELCKARNKYNLYEIIFNLTEIEYYIKIVENRYNNIFNE